MPASEQPKNRLTRPRGRPRLEDVAEIENKLLDVALQEFMEHGYGGTSVTKIVKKARVSKTTIYSRFASKQDLFQAIMQKQIERLAPASLLASSTGIPDLEQGLKSYANHMLELSLEDELLGVNRLVYSECHRFPELGAAAAERTRLGIQRISDFIRDCAAYDKIPCKDPESAAEVFILMIRGWYINVVLTNRKVSAKERQQWVDRSIHVLQSSREAW